MKIQAKIERLVKGGSVKAVASITLDGWFVVKNLRVVDGSKGLFVSMPQESYYQYGEWIDPADFGDPEGEGYYEAKTQEAISYASFGGTSDEIGKAFAELFYESSGHWSYVGSSDFLYTGIGVTKSGSRWYVCVMVGEVNYG